MAFHILREIKEGLPPIEADFDKVVQVLVNVLKNALEASGKDDNIEVGMDFGQLRGKPAVAVSITDHGKGILARNLDNIYRPFFTTKKKGHRFGTSRREKDNGCSPGRDFDHKRPRNWGTTVRLLFGSVGGFIMRKILIVDDDPSLCAHLLALYFRSRQYDTSISETGRGGLELWRSEDPDLVLLDVQLPDMDGPEVLDSAKKEGLKGEVIMITAFNDTQATLKAIRLGALDYLYKPIDLNALDLLLEKTIVRKKERERLTKLSHVISPTHTNRIRSSAEAKRPSR